MGIAFRIRSSLEISFNAHKSKVISQSVDVDVYNIFIDSIEQCPIKGADISARLTKTHITPSSCCHLKKKFRHTLTYTEIP